MRLEDLAPFIGDGDRVNGLLQPSAALASTFGGTHLFLLEESLPRRLPHLLVLAIGIVEVFRPFSHSRPAHLARRSSALHGSGWHSPLLHHLFLTQFVGGMELGKIWDRDYRRRLSFDFWKIVQIGLKGICDAFGIGVACWRDGFRSRWSRRHDRRRSARSHG